MSEKELATVTKADLAELKTSLEESFKVILEESKRKQRYYTPMRFSTLTGMPYSTVVEHCQRGILKACQDRPGSSWRIDADEVESMNDSDNKP